MIWTNPERPTYPGQIAEAPANEENEARAISVLETTNQPGPGPLHVQLVSGRIHVTTSDPAAADVALDRLNAREEKATTKRRASTPAAQPSDSSTPEAQSENQSQ